MSGEKTEMEIKRQAQAHKAELDQLNKVHTMKVADIEKLAQKHTTESAELSSRIENEKKAQTDMLAKNKEEMKKVSHVCLVYIRCFSVCLKIMRVLMYRLSWLCILRGTA